MHVNFVNLVLIKLLYEKYFSALIMLEINDQWSNKTFPDLKYGCSMAFFIINVV